MSDNKHANDVLVNLSREEQKALSDALFSYVTVDVDPFPASKPQVLTSASDSIPPDRSESLKSYFDHMIQLRRNRLKVIEGLTHIFSNCLTYLQNHYPEDTEEDRRNKATFQAVDKDAALHFLRMIPEKPDENFIKGLEVAREIISEEQFYPSQPEAKTVNPAIQKAMTLIDFIEVMSKLESCLPEESKGLEESSNPNNCETCDHKKRPDGGWCYMFRTEPTEVCRQHTGYSRLNNIWEML